MHMSPEGTKRVYSLIEKGGISRTLTVLGFAPEKTTRVVTGIMGSTGTGTRGGRRVSTSGLCITSVITGRKPAVGEFVPETVNETAVVEGEASRVRIILGREGWLVSEESGGKSGNWSAQAGDQYCGELKLGVIRG